MTNRQPVVIDSLEQLKMLVAGRLDLDYSQQVSITIDIPADRFFYPFGNELFINMLRQSDELDSDIPFIPFSVKKIKNTVAQFHKYRFSRRHFFVNHTKDNIFSFQIVEYTPNPFVILHTHKRSAIEVVTDMSYVSYILCSTLGGCKMSYTVDTLLPTSTVMDIDIDSVFIKRTIPDSKIVY